MCSQWPAESALCTWCARLIVALMCFRNISRFLLPELGYWVKKDVEEQLSFARNLVLLHVDVIKRLLQLPIN